MAAPFTEDGDEEITSDARTKSDMMSGMKITRDHTAYDAFTQDQLEAHFARFKQYDVDQSGFITPDNLKAIFEALELSEVTEAQCVNMIAEAAMLVGHENDGQMSFRDYCALMAYEAKKHVITEAVEAKEEELDANIAAAADGEAHLADASAVDVTDEEAAEVYPNKRSSFAMLDEIAGSRIHRFEQMLKDTAAEQSMATGEAIRQTKFAGKLAKFKRLESANGSDAAPKLNAENTRMQTLKAKLAAFEEAGKQADPVAFKTSWKSERQGTWRQKKEMAGGVAPKRSLADLP